ncbi:hypothetical protein PR202_ga22451 [Eleusine coracana subsp. coracana]|uniref:Uncharacterized protein n=1 Tax=Eleusine coracana subsp. coracana TaxID=191504 RepID=A0AAV5D3N2_ELECO|nr:hypothetical protein PR202_ga22451 [Eleusine coracana subsp. coracana]
MNPTLDVDVEDFGNDDEYVSSEDEVPQKKIGRGSNFTAAEDKTLVKAWRAVALDPITGIEQPGGTYWKRIHNHFVRNNKSGILRSQISVTHGWQVIQVSCTRWYDCLEQVERLNPSGANI